MKVSVLTPTHNRPRCIEYLYRIFKAQTYPDKELVIADDSPEPNPFFVNLRDPSVRYIYFNARGTIGMKRDRLMQESYGDYVIHFDDDDYYAPGYIEFVVDKLKDADFFKLTSWFGYDTRSLQFHYWDTPKILPFHYLLAAPNVVGIFDTANIKNKPEWVENNVWGYGFSYAFRRTLYRTVRFDPQYNWGEDLDFVKRVRLAGFKTIIAPDLEGLAIHMIHRANASAMHPNYLLPDFMVEKLFGQAAVDFVKHFSG